MRWHPILPLLLAALALPLGAARPWALCGTSGHYTANSTYQANLRLLSTTLPKNASSSPDLFATAAVGTVPDIAYAMALCRGDINVSACADCVSTAFPDAQQICPYRMGVSICYDTDACFLRFSNQFFLNSTDNSGEMTFGDGNSVTTNVGHYARVVTNLLNATAVYAANSTKRFATGEAPFDDAFPKIYAMAQCRPDLSPAQCRGCFSDMLGRWWKTFDRSTQGLKMVGSRCIMRVDVHSFYNGPAMLQLPADAAKPAPEPVAVPGSPVALGGKTSNETGKILAIVLPVAAAILAATVICFCFWRRRRPAKRPPLPSFSHMEDIQSMDSLILDLSTFRAATANFAESNKLGQGGFGAVYKGTLPDGQEIAVKRLSQRSRQGIGELMNELVLVAKLKHKNLVRLLGVCLEEHEKLLVYEDMSNKSLDTFLFDRDKSKELDWGKRFKIIIGIARGLQYLHEDSQLKIVHRDLKASNVLLGSEMNPKISDFGLARLFDGDQSRDVTKRIAGTYGYMAPEYAMRGHYSIKSDVFSFGVLILEIVTGSRSSASYNSEQYVNLLSLIWEHWTTGAIAEMMDSSMRDHCQEEQMLKCVNVGLLCVQENPTDRPMMSTVNVMLSSDAGLLPAPSRPAFCIQELSQYEQSTGKSRPMSHNEVSITEFEPR